MNRLLVPAAALSAAVLLFAVRPARAGTATNTLTVSANVLGICTIDAAALNFGAYDPSAAAPNNAQGTITVHCTQGTGFWIGLNDGANAAAPGARRMAGGVAEFLSYSLYRDAARTVAWDNANPALAYHFTASTAAAGYSPYTYTVYGQIPTAQSVSTGAYGDSVTMTVNF